MVISASPDRRSENVRVLPVIISELKLGNIQRHIFAAHFVERADYAALQDRPKSFNRLSVDSADDILTSRMVNGRARVIHVERFIARILIRAKQADIMMTPAMAAGIDARLWSLEELVERATK